MLIFIKFNDQFHQKCGFEMVFIEILPDDFKNNLKF